METGAEENRATEDLGVLYLCESSLCGSVSAFVFLEYTDPSIRGLQTARQPVRSSASEPRVRRIAPKNEEGEGGEGGGEAPAAPVCLRCFRR